MERSALWALLGAAYLNVLVTIMTSATAVPVLFTCTIACLALGAFAAAGFGALREAHRRVLVTQWWVAGGRKFMPLKANWIDPTAKRLDLLGTMVGLLEDLKRGVALGETAAKAVEKAMRMTIEIVGRSLNSALAYGVVKNTHVGGVPPDSLDDASLRRWLELDFAQRPLLTTADHIRAERR